MKHFHIKGLTSVLLRVVSSFSSALLSSLFFSSSSISRISSAPSEMTFCEGRMFKINYQNSLTCGVCISAAVKAALQFVKAGFLLRQTFCVISSQNKKYIKVFFTICISVSPEELLLSLDVDEELLPYPLHATFNAGRVNFVEEEVHKPGAQERHPSHCHHHSHLFRRHYIEVYLLNSFIYLILPGAW